MTSLSSRCAYGDWRSTGARTAATVSRNARDVAPSGASDVTTSAPSGKFAASSRTTTGPSAAGAEDETNRARTAVTDGGAAPTRALQRSSSSSISQREQLVAPTVS